ncbi:MAG: hypothetical protein MJ107_01030 [Lachnospiraceae bacterium]|nr:hypothetical protein [Lachnospiraceae bacterium]
MAFIALLICMAVFFLWAHPLYIYDTDDWTYISNNRLGIPMPNAWNPTKVLPECLLPLIGEIGATVIYPFTGDYIQSIAFATGIFVSVLFTVFLVFFSIIIKNKFSLSLINYCFLLIFLTITMFTPYYTQEYMYSHMFYGGGVNALFNYIVPNVFNGILLFIIWNDEEMNWFDSKHVVKNSIVVLLVYLCIFSSLTSSIIFMSFVGSLLFFRLISLLLKLLKKEKLHKVILRFIKENAVYLGILMCWFLALYLEGNGRRAGWAIDTSYGSVGETIRNLITGLKEINKIFWLMLLSCVTAGLATYLFRRVVQKNVQEKDREYVVLLLRNVFSLILVTVYLVLVSSKLAPGYIRNSSVNWGIVFYLVIIMFLCIGYIVSSFEWVGMTFPLLAFVLISVFVITKNNYKDTYTPSKIKRIDDDIVSQIIEAEKNGDTYVEVYVPKHINPEWPIVLSYGGERIYKTLFQHGIINSEMEVILVPSEEKNAEFGYPEE